MIALKSQNLRRCNFVPTATDISYRIRHFKRPCSYTERLLTIFLSKIE